MYFIPDTILGALVHIIPYLTETLAKQGECDDDDWTPAKAAGVCIMLLAQCTGDSIVQIILPFIQQHLKDADWRYFFVFHYRS